MEDAGLSFLVCLRHCAKNSVMSAGKHSLLNAFFSSEGGFRFRSRFSSIRTPCPVFLQLASAAPMSRERHAAY